MVIGDESRAALTVMWNRILLDDRMQIPDDVRHRINELFEEGLGDSAPDRQPSDAAVEAAVIAYWEHPASHGQNTAARHRATRAALEAAYEVDRVGAPRPLLDREEARVAAREAIAAEVNSWPDDAGLPYFPADLHTATTMQRLANPAVDAVMGLARPMPTMQAIARTVYEQDMADGAVRPNPWESASEETRVPYERAAWAVLALLNGDKTSGAPSSGQ